MVDVKDYYAILGIEHGATPEAVKRAYIDKCYILHPDRLQGAPESARRSAEEELKRVNRAYETLRDPRKRAAYDSGQEIQQDKPKPIVEPKSIEFRELAPSEIRSASFVIRNAGGPYKKIWFSNPNTWLRVTHWQSVSPSDELPLRVTVEVEAPSIGKAFSDVITVKLDDEVTTLGVSLLVRSPIAKPAKPLYGILGRLLGKSKETNQLRRPLTLTDHRWHELEEKSLPKWIAKQRHRLDEGQEVVGRTFRYRRNGVTKNYEIRLRYKRKQGVFR